MVGYVQRPTAAAPGKSNAITYASFFVVSVVLSARQCTNAVMLLPCSTAATMADSVQLYCRFSAHIMTEQDKPAAASSSLTL